MKTRVRPAIAVAAVLVLGGMVVAGPGAGSELEKAQKLKLTILEEQQFLELIRE